MRTVAFLLRIEPELLRVVRHLAAELGVPINKVVKIALERFIHEYAKPGRGRRQAGC